MSRTWVPHLGLVIKSKTVLRGKGGPAPFRFRFRSLWRPRQRSAVSQTETYIQEDNGRWSAGLADTSGFLGPFKDSCPSLIIHVRPPPLRPRLFLSLIAEHLSFGYLFPVQAPAVLVTAKQSPSVFKGGALYVRKRHHFVVLPAESGHYSHRGRAQ